MKFFSSKLKSYSKEFIQNEDGMEAVQVAVIIALSAGLIAVLAFLFTMIGKKIGEAGEAVDAMDTNTNVTTNPYSSAGN